MGSDRRPAQFDDELTLEVAVTRLAMLTPLGRAAWLPAALTVVLLVALVLGPQRLVRLPSARPDNLRRVAAIVAAYGEWCDIATEPQLIVAASRLEEEHTLSFWDSLIVQAAIQAGADRLVSEDLQHGRRFEVLEPLAEPVAFEVVRGSV